MSVMIEMKDLPEKRKASCEIRSRVMRYPSWLFSQEYSGIFEPLPNYMSARLMFYLSCVYKVVDIRDADSIEELIDYEHYTILSTTNLEKLIIMSIALSPDRLLNKCFFADDEKCGDLLNEFYRKEDLAHEFKIPDHVQIGEEERALLRVMCLKRQFLLDNYHTPLKFYRNKIMEICDTLDRQEVTKIVKNENVCFCTIL